MFKPIKKSCSIAKKNIFELADQINQTEFATINTKSAKNLFLAIKSQPIILKLIAIQSIFLSLKRYNPKSYFRQYLVFIGSW